MEVSVPDHLRFLKGEFSDEIPDEVIHFNKFKVRRNWWVGLLGALQNGLADGVFSDPRARLEIENFTNFYLDSANFFDKPLTTQEDISRANRIINIALGEDPNQQKRGFQT